MQNFSKQSLNQDSDIIGMKLTKAAKVIVKAMDGRAAVKRKITWQVPPESFPMQSVSSRITHFFADCFKGSNLFEMGMGVPLLRWSGKSCTMFHAILPTLFCVCADLMIKKSMGFHPVASLGELVPAIWSRHHRQILVQDAGV